MTFSKIHADIRDPLAQYAMYLRKSRADVELEALGQEETLARHKTMLYALAERHHILPSQITVFHEIVSGDSIDDRPEVQRLLKEVYAQKYRGVLVVEVERLARGNTKDQGEVADAFTFSHTLIITPAKVYDPENEFDQEYFEFGLFMSRREYKTICRRLEAGKLQSVQEGNFLSATPPYGYQVIRTSRKERYLVENPEESPIVRRIFDWYTEERKPASWIARQLTLMGIPTKKRSREWSATNICDILRNPHYIGMVTWGRQKTIRVKNQTTGKIEKKRRIIKEHPVFKGKHAAIISEEQFARARAIYGSHAPDTLQHELVNPLSGLLVCAYCGRAIVFQRYQDGRHSRYLHKRGVYACRIKSLHAQIVLDALVAALSAKITEILEPFKECGTDDSSKSLAALETELARQERMKLRLFESWEANDGAYTKAEFLERKQMYTQAIETLKIEIEQRRQSIPVPEESREKLNALRDMIRCLQEPDTEARVKNDFLKQYIDKITFDSIDFGHNKGGEAVLEVILKSQPITAAGHQKSLSVRQAPDEDMEFQVSGMSGLKEIGDSV